MPSKKSDVIVDHRMSETGAKAAFKMMKLKYNCKMIELPIYDKKSYMWRFKYSYPTKRS